MVIGGCPGELVQCRTSATTLTMRILCQCDTFLAPASMVQEQRGVSRHKVGVEC